MQLLPTHWVGTDAGIARDLNEDAFLWLGPNDTEGHGWLWLVADGQGGAAAGDLAAALLVTTFEDMWAESIDQTRDFSVAVRQIIGEVCARIAQIESAFDSLRGLCSAVAIVAHINGRMWTAHVGDCRVSRVRDGKLEALTVDHLEPTGATEIAGRRPTQADEVHRLSRVVGSQRVEPEVREIDDLRDGDVIFVTSDGIHGVLDTAAFVAVASAAERDAVDQIVAAAREAWSDDNLTAAVIRLVSVLPSATELPPRSNVTTLPGPLAPSRSAPADPPIEADPTRTLSFSPDVLRQLRAQPAPPSPQLSTGAATHQQAHSASAATSTLLFSRADLAALESSSTRTGLLAGRIVEAARRSAPGAPEPTSRVGNAASVGVRPAVAGVGAELSGARSPHERQAMKPANTERARDGGASETLAFDDEEPPRSFAPDYRKSLLLSAFVVVLALALLVFMRRAEHSSHSGSEDGVHEGSTSGE